MKFPGSIGVMIIIISFFGVAFISAIEITPINKENTDYEYKPENLLKNQSEVKLSEYQDYVIPKEENEKNTQHDIIFYNRDKGHFKQKAGLTNSDITPLRTILNSLKYSENCESITIDLNLKMENWKEWYMKYPTTPILCTQKEDYFTPIGISTEYKGTVNNIIFDYKIGDSVIYLKNFDKNMKYTGSGGINLPIDTLFIGHHYSTVLHVTTHRTVNLPLNESEYKFKWCEKDFKNNSFSNFIIDLEETQPSLHSNIYSGQYSYKVNLSNFTKYGDKLTINGTFYSVINNQIIIEEPYDLKNIDILYENKNCIVTLNDDKTIDLGPICNYQIIGSGDWAFKSKFYEGNHTNEIIGYEWTTNPSALFNINSSFIIMFIGAVAILSGLCSLSVGLNFIDLAVIISIIAFILVVL